MSEPTNQPDNSAAKQNKSNKRTTVVLVIFAIIIVAQGIKIYLDHQTKMDNKTKIATTEKDLAVTMQRLTDIREELEEKIRTIDSLGGDISELTEAKAEIEEELSKERNFNAVQLRRLRSKAEGYETLLKAKDKEIEKLEQMNEVLLTENTTLKSEKNQLSDSLSQLNVSKEKLASQVELASRLKAENIMIYGVNKRGKEREAPFKSRQAEKLKVVFNIAENEVAPIEGKNIIVKITDEQGQVIFDVSRGSGTFMIGGKEEFYTANQEILFDNTRQQLTFEYDKGSEFEEGLYTMEVYTDEYKMGSKQFEVK